MTSSATSRPSTLPDSERTRPSNSWPPVPNVSSKEYPVPRKTDSAEWTIWSVNNTLFCSMSVSPPPRSSAAKPMMSLRRLLSP
jgi:hypothetical protein